MGQIKCLGIFQAGLPFELDVSVTVEDMDHRQQKERLSLGFWSQLWKGAETHYSNRETHRAIASSSIHSTPPSRASYTAASAATVG